MTTPENEHTCHAHRCDTPVHPRLLMCSRHWRLVTLKLQRAVWAAYVPGQEITKECSTAWHAAANRAIAVVARKEGYEAIANVWDERAQRDETESGKEPAAFSFLNKESQR